MEVGKGMMRDLTERKIVFELEVVRGLDHVREN